MDTKPPNETPQPIAATVAVTLARPTLSGHMRTRINFGVPHLLSAALFSRATKALEVKHQGEPLGEFWEDVLAQATAAVFTSVAGLESYANELFADHQWMFPTIRSDLVKALWDVYERKTLLEKFDLALTLQQLPPLDRKAQSFQDADLLIRLRNSLVHFKPEWEDERVKHDRLSAELLKRFPSSPFTPGAPLFPMAWASHACTAWAVTSVLTFIQEFETAAKLPARIDKFIARISNH
jgi:hypothetical protein